MKKSLLFTLIATLAWVMTACSNDSDYHYPSVKLEFLTATSDKDGKLTSILSDEGTSYTIAQDATGNTTHADTTLRIVANYEPLSATLPEAKLYAWTHVTSPLPLQAGRFEQGVETSPVNIVSVWKGLNYVNMILTVREQSGQHRFHFAEEQVLTDLNASTRRIYITLYHHIEQTQQDYDKRVYLSMPTAQYLSPDIAHTELYLTIHTYTGEAKVHHFTL